ncbi:uncharacterized protein LOC106708444 [Papilio machaon]|uniref:uncharacterized protein LOC106708444 n=1 Tax=Papilio machaon TaxID=76193 RepID=UPI0006EB13FF|nr:uncharacterized protein LOC106708444 [Papilio machaon]
MMTSTLSRYRKPMIKYPKDTLFWVTDFLVKGCRNFLDDCPIHFRYQHICAISYNGEYKDFSDFCTMHYENCNTWRNWRVFKRERC